MFYITDYERNQVQDEVDECDQFVEDFDDSVVNDKKCEEAVPDKTPA